MSFSFHISLFSLFLNGQSANSNQQSSNRQKSHDKPIQYTDGKYKTVDAFLKHKDFRVFKKQFTALIDGVTAFSRDHAEKVTPPITAGRLAAIEKDFGTLKKHLFDSDQNYFDTHKNAVYGVGKECFDQFSRMLQDERIPLQTRLDAVTTLSESATVCSGGLLAGLQDAIGKLNSSASGIKGLAPQLRIKMMEAVVLAHIKKNHRSFSRGDEVHLVNAYLNGMADALGIPKRNDPFIGIGKKEITPALLKECQESISKKVTPVRIAKSLAQDYEEEIHSAFTGEDHGNIPAGSIGKVTEKISALQAATLDVKYGKVPHNDLLAANEDYSYAKSDSTVLAVHMLGKLSEAKMVDLSDVITLKKGDAADGDIMQLDDLFWRNSGGQCEQITGQDICGIPPENIFHAIAQVEGINNQKRVSILQNIRQYVIENSASEKDIPDIWRNGIQKQLNLIKANVFHGWIAEIADLAPADRGAAFRKASSDISYLPIEHRLDAIRRILDQIQTIESDEDKVAIFHAAAGRFFAVPQSDRGALAHAIVNKTDDSTVLRELAGRITSVPESERGAFVHAILNKTKDPTVLRELADHINAIPEAERSAVNLAIDAARNK